MPNIKKAHKNLMISRLLAPILGSRDIVDILEKIIKKTDVKSINLDFSNVKVVSRSSAHALLLMKDRLYAKKDISFINTNEDVTNMLRIVAANRIVPKKKKPNFNPEKISIKDLFKMAA